MATAGARHILVKTQEEAEKLKKQLDKGADFGQLAKKTLPLPLWQEGRRPWRISSGTNGKSL